MIVTYKQREQIFKAVRAKVDEEARLVQDMPVNVEKQRLMRTRYIEGMQQALLFLNEVLDK